MAKYRHKASGKLYDLVGAAQLQTDKPLNDMAEVTVYRGADGQLWVRDASEFDIRFESTSPAKKVATVKGNRNGK